MARRGWRIFPRQGLAGPALAAAVCAGAGWLFLEGAPRAYPLVNLAALAIGFAAMLAMRRVPLAVSLLAAPLLAALALWSGPAIEGVQRWIALGDLRLHAVMLAGPAFAVAAARSRGWMMTLATAALAAATACQPDLGTAIALACAAAVITLERRDLPALLALACAAAAVWASVLSSASPAAVPFVEGVVQRMAHESDLLAIIALVLLAGAAIAPALRQRDRRAGGAALAAWTVGLIAASLIGPYPTPLLGYGAAPIIGYAIALGLFDARKRFGG